MAKKAAYVIDDTFEIPEDIKNMSKEELAREIAILEEEGRKVAETLPDMEPLRCSVKNGK